MASTTRWVLVLGVMLSLAECFTCSSLSHGDELIALGPATNLSRSSARSWSQRLAVDGDRVYALWEELPTEFPNTGPYTAFRISTDSGETWSPSLAAAPRDLNAEFGVPRLDGGDKFSSAWRITVVQEDVLVSWVEGVGLTKALKLRRSNDGGITFGPAQTLASGFGCCGADNSGAADSVTLNAFGQDVYLTYSTVGSGGRRLALLRSTDAGQNWAGAVDLSGDTGCDLGPRIAKTGLEVVVAFACNFVTDIFVRRSLDKGTTFGPLVNVSNEFGSSGTRARSPDVAISNGTIFVTWARDAAVAGSPAVRRSVDGGQTWIPALGGAPELLGSTPLTVPLLVSDNKSTHVAWFSGATFRTRRSLDGGATWDPAPSFEARVISAAVSAGPGLFTKAATDLLLIYQGAAGIELVRSKDEGASWEAPAVISNDPAASSDSPLQFAYAGSEALFLWRDATGEVWFRNAQLLHGDTFDDNSLSLERWDVLVPPPGFGASVVERNQRLEVSVGPGAGGAGVVSKCFLAGDFDVQVDFTLLNWPANNQHNVRLGAADVEAGPNGGVGINRSSFDSESYFLALTSTGARVPATGTSGSLRLVRQGTILSGLFWDGNNWSVVGGGAAGTTATRVTLDVGTSDPTANAAAAAFDSFIIHAGDPTCALVQRSDLIVQDLTVKPAGAAPGSEIVAALTIKNQGPGVSAVSTTNIRLSNSSTDVRATDPLLASVRTRMMFPGESVTLTESVTVPPVEAGAYSIWGIADATRTANQTDGTNDRRSVGFRVSESTSARQSAITIIRAGDGAGIVTSSPSGLECGETCSALFRVNSVVTLNAIASSDSVLIGHDIPGCFLRVKCQVRITDTDQTVRVTFVRKPAANDPKLIYVGLCGAEEGSVASFCAGYDPFFRWHGSYNPLIESDLNALGFDVSGLDAIGAQVGTLFPNNSVRRIVGVGVFGGSIQFDTLNDTIKSVVSFVRSVYVDGDKVYLVGHSLSAGLIPRIATELQRHKISIEMTAQIDSVAVLRKGRSDDAIPSNVKRGFNFYHPVEKATCFVINRFGVSAIPLIGEDNVIPLDPARTTVTNEAIAAPVGPDEPLDTDCNPHRNMDNDPRVWQPIRDHIIKSFAE